MVNEDREIDGQDEYPKVTGNTTRRQKAIIDLWTTANVSGLDQDVHVIPLDSLFQRFHTNQRSGLSTRFVVDARSQYGKNKITPGKSASYFCLLLKQLLMGFNSILWVGGILAFVAYEPLGGSSPSTTNLGLGVILFLVIIFNAILNFSQEIKSIKIVASFSKQLPMIATVRRDGIEQQIVADEIVPGDIILIRMGDKLPADCRFLACDGIKVNRLFATFCKIVLSLFLF
jgi:sodium/potassium-transporting ATPase subunit alpha